MNHIRFMMSSNMRKAFHALVEMVLVLKDPAVFLFPHQTPNLLVQQQIQAAM
jgi:hypothetical protein